MAALNQSTAILFLVLIFSIKLSHCVGNNNTIFCPQIEKQSLLNFKQSLTDPNNLLRSWDSEVNCCKWEGVVCSNLSGHVYELHLGERDLEGNISSSLLNLTRLRYLDLSLNNFEQTIPSFFGSFTNLEYLNLSFVWFHGKIPHSLGNLSNLRTLDLEMEFSGGLAADRLEWLSGLSKLEYLNMNGANLSSATDWPQAINALPSLLELHFQHCEQFVASMNYVNATSLQFLDLSNNNNHPSSPVPTWIFQFSNLLSLDIQFSNLVGPIPSISNITKLQHIDLGSNELSSSIPGWLFLCTDLVSVVLSNSWLAGEIPREIGNLEALEVLSLEENNFSGELPLEFAELKSLRILSLNGNSFSGAIPTGLGKLSSLEVLALGGNKFSGNLPASFGQLSNLTNFYIYDNLLEGVVSEGHFANLTNLKMFYASTNRLSLKIGVNWVPPFQLTTLELRDWNLSTSFDQGLSWLQTQEDLNILDVSNTGISGQIPIWIFNVSTLYLNISHNKIQGKIPRIPVGALFMFLSSNQLSGSLPQIPDQMIALDLSDNSFSGGLSHFLCNGTYSLEVLHLRGNQLGGKLPDCSMQWSSLTYLNLGNNMMFGSIPTTFGYLVSLMSLNLYGNKFSGQIPLSMQKCTELLKMDLSHNDLDGNIPEWLGTSLPKLKFLILSSNKLSGEISPKICHLNSLQILDLSHNNLSGTVPSCANNFTAMSSKQSFDILPWYSLFYTSLDDASITTKGRELQYDTILFLVTSIDLSTNNLSGEIPKELTSLVKLITLNLSQNHFTGSIPDRIGDMKQLESLDVSRNSLSGPIPNSITLISSLSYLDLSYNNLTGKIPDGTQIRGFNASFFVGNNLCGPPMTSSCGGDGDEFPRRRGHERAEIEWFYVFLSSGFAIGVSIACSAMALKKSWREAYYGWLECIWDKLYVFVCVHWRRLKFLKRDQNLN